MALSTTILPPNPNPNPNRSFHSLVSSSFLPLTSIKLPPKSRSNFKSKSRRNPAPPLSISCSSTKIVRCPSLDRHASSHNRLRFVRKLTTLLLSKPRHFLPLPILSRCRPYLSLPPGRPLLSMVHRYPTIFLVLPTSPDLSVSLSPAALSLFSLRSNLSSSLPHKLHKLLMLSSHRQLLLSKLVHIAPDLGLPPNFRSRMCNAHPDRFHTVHTSYGRALRLASWNPELAVPVSFPIRPPAEEDRPIIDRPPKFNKVRLRRGLNVKRRHLDFLIRFQELREVNPYDQEAEEKEAVLMGAEEREKRACAVVREVLGMTVEKRTLVDHLTHFRKDFGLPNKLRAMLVRHPEMFYVSVKGVRDSVFLVEAYDDKGKLRVEDEQVTVKKKLEELVREGKRMRRERRRGVGVDRVEGDAEEEEEEEFFEDEDDDGFGDLFESGIDDDWEDFGHGGAGDEEVKEIVEFWSSVTEGGDGMLQAW